MIYICMGYNNKVICYRGRVYNDIVSILRTSCSHTILLAKTIKAYNLSPFLEPLDATTKRILVEKHQLSSTEVKQRRDRPVLNG